MYLAANSTTILESLRALMTIANIGGLIVPSGDAHYTEFIAECHERRAFISGFTGSAGTAIVTQTEALLWTDGRYYLQAEQQLDPALWTLMKDGLAGVPSQSQWLKDNIPAGESVGVDPTLYSKAQWDNMQRELQSVGKSLVPTENNLVDEVWSTDRPPCASDPVIELGIEFAGIRTEEKLKNVRKEMADNGAAALIVAELDEVAWLLNLRGSDIPFSATFFAYVLVTETNFHVFINQIQLSSNITDTLRANVPEIQFHEYTDITRQLNETVHSSADSKIWFNQNTNYALINLIPADRQIMKLTPIALMKAIKNPTEVDGYRKALIRDAAALCEFFAWLEPEISSGAVVTEISAAQKLVSFRSQRENFFNESFPAISAAGPNGAVIHYMPTPETDRRINPNDMYLLDSGALYKDGTTDITRTVHFGVPTEHQKDCYTRVLKGQIALTRAIFPNRMVGSRLDSFARQFLWEAGLDYAHGTGHGVGSFLNVHEGPFSLGSGHSSLDPGFRENFFTSNEPGYYEDGEFGIRLENLIRVKNVSLDHNFQNRGFLGFEDLTFVPYEHKLINFSLITTDEASFIFLSFIHRYNKRLGWNDAAYDWLFKATVPLNQNGPIQDPTSTTPSDLTSTSPSETPSSSNTEGSSSETPSSSTTSKANEQRTNLMLPMIPVVIFKALKLV
ncbi:Xaa-Pro aminopeptidase 1 [Orchesella cincta]|uniref:Xaa-Pro aminopeptidase 1 n=1 Tax=Orchesella cincta TaxID=48709 RepID=A0A1D2NJL3_ORCCI|nr:Xaa-Pro aminopeptidase 1 [Orchesella cincta]